MYDLQMQTQAILQPQSAAYPGAALLDQVSDCIIVVTRFGNVAYANPAAHAAGVATLLRTGEPLHAASRRDGQAAEATVNEWWQRVTPTPDGDFTMIARRDTGAAISALHKAEARLTALFQQAQPDMLILQLPAVGEVVIEKANDAFCLTSGMSSNAAMAQPLSVVFDQATAEALADDARRCVAEGGFERQRTLLYPAGQRRIKAHYRLLSNDANGTQRVLLSQTDLTDTHRIESALRQALRLEVIGQLTGGVAHDFNNLLTAILGSLELLARNATEDRQRRWIRIANEAANRGATLTQQLLSYARKQFLAPVPTDIPAALNEMTALISGSLGSRIQFRTEFAPDTWLAITDIAQLELALLNLMVNARTAMPNGGSLLLATRNHSTDMPGLPWDLTPGEYVVVTVADTGHGMDPDTLASAMEPFFTTKGIGEGSGLGLSQAYGFARQLGGTVRLTSMKNAGTVAEIFLPGATLADGMLGRVLVADGSASRRETIAGVLKPLGWALDEAATTEAALECMAAADYAVMVIDLELAGNEATQLARRAKALHKRTGLVFLTSTPDPVIAAGLPGVVIAKSALADELAQSVQSALTAT